MLRNLLDGVVIHHEKERMLGTKKQDCVYRRAWKEVFRVILCGGHRNSQVAVRTGTPGELLAH